MRVKLYAFYAPQSPNTMTFFSLSLIKAIKKTEKFNEDLKGAAAKTFG